MAVLVRWCSCGEDEAHLGGAWCSGEGSARAAIRGSAPIALPLIVQEQHSSIASSHRTERTPLAPLVAYRLIR